MIHFVTCIFIPTQLSFSIPQVTFTTKINKNANSTLMMIGNMSSRDRLRTFGSLENFEKYQTLNQNSFVNIIEKPFIICDLSIFHMIVGSFGMYSR